MTSAETLQDWLALEHEAVWLYPVVGARFDALAKPARTAYRKHRDVRDGLLSRLHQMDLEPVPTRLSYDTGRLRTKAAALAAAQRIEREIAATCLTLVGESSGDLQAYALQGLRRASLAELGWGGTPRAFPGLP
jgi:hypothetical protein